MCAQQVRPGVYQPANLEQLLMLKEHQTRIESENRSKGQRYSHHREEYTHLRSRLETIADYTHYKAMIPLGKKAFMMGELTHTNEVLVLLGDNYFAERSAKQAMGIVDRRIAQCDEMLSKLNEEARLIKTWKKETENLSNDVQGNEGSLEIREPYDPEEEKRWRKDHKQRVLEERKRQDTDSNHQSGGGGDDDDELWRRLDELELEEELDEHLAMEDEMYDEDESSLEEEESDEDGKPKLKRKVSFGSVEAKEYETNELKEGANGHVIVLKHSDPRAEPSAAKFDVGPRPLTPADLEREFIKPVKKSILKPFDATNINVDHDHLAQIKQEEEEAPKGPRQFIHPTAVSDVVVEKEDPNEIKPASTDIKRPSKFKQNRQQRHKV